MLIVSNKSRNMLAPIVLFVYNRPQHTLQTLEALTNNMLADQSLLYIYADGAKDGADEDTFSKIKETREIIRQKKWCKEVSIIESENNKGLAESIIKGVSDIVNRYGKVIVLEDDIVTSPGFLQYMNDALSLYENKEKVMHVSGFTPQTTGEEKLPETYFLRFMSCWGWATWKRAWDKLILNTDQLYNEIPKLADYKCYNLDGYKNMFLQVEENYNGTLNTWAIKWYSSIFLNKGLCLYPNKTLVRNIGFDGSGIHCGKDELSAIQHNSLDLAEGITIAPIEVKQSKYAYNYLKRFYRFGTDSSLKRRFLYYINNLDNLKKLDWFQKPLFYKLYSILSGR